MTTRWPEIAQHLEKIPYFVAVARAGSLQKAARELHIAQPSLTKSVHLLEEALKVTLFRRSRQGMSLTPAGEEFYRFAEPLLISLIKVERHVQDISGDSAAGEVRLGTHEILVREFWPPLIRDLRRSFPRLKLTLMTTPSVGDLARRLQAGELDVIVAVECQTNPHYQSREIRADAYGFYASAGFCREHRLTSKSKLTLASLNALPLIYASDVIAGAGRKLSTALAEAGYHLPSLYAVHSLESVASLIESGLGLGLLPRLMVGADRHSRLIELKAPKVAQGRLGKHRLFVATTTRGQADGRILAVIEKVEHLLTLKSKTN